MKKEDRKFEGICINCKKEKNHIHSSGKSKGLCKECYRKLIWNPKLRECKRCERMKKHHAYNLCSGCYNSVYHGEKVRLHNAKRYHNINPEIYKKVIEKCVLCGFDKIVEMHHLDHDKNNNSENNLAGLCPNHHKMLHAKAHQKEVFDILKNKGFKVPEKGYKTDGFFKKQF